MVPEVLQVPGECPLDSCRFAGEALILEVAQEPVADMGPGKTRQVAASRREIATRLVLERPCLDPGNSGGKRMEEEEVRPVEEYLAGCATGINTARIGLPLVTLEEGVEPANEIEDALGQPVSLRPDLAAPPEPGLQRGVEVPPRAPSERSSDVAVGEGMLHRRYLMKRCRECRVGTAHRTECTDAA
jgi:hypothetical protein